jgi:hypothetical protein
MWEHIRELQKQQNWSDSTLLYLVLSFIGKDDTKLMQHLLAAAKHENDMKARIEVKKLGPNEKRDKNAIPEEDSFSFETFPQG